VFFFLNEPATTEIYTLSLRDALPIWYALVAGVVGLKEINVGDPYAPPVEPPSCREKVEDTIGELKRLLKERWACFR